MVYNTIPTMLILTLKLTSTLAACENDAVILDDLNEIGITIRSKGSRQRTFVIQDHHGLIPPDNIDELSEDLLDVHNHVGVYDELFEIARTSIHRLLTDIIHLRLTAADPKCSPRAIAVTQECLSKISDKTIGKEKMREAVIYALQIINPDGVDGYTYAKIQRSVQSKLLQLKGATAGRSSSGTPDETVPSDSLSSIPLSSADGRPSSSSDCGSGLKRIHNTPFTSPLECPMTPKDAPPPITLEVDSGLSGSEAPTVASIKGSRSGTKFLELEKNKSIEKIDRIYQKPHDYPEVTVDVYRTVGKDIIEQYFIKKRTTNPTALESHSLATEPVLDAINKSNLIGARFLAGALEYTTGDCSDGSRAVEIWMEHYSGGELSNLVEFLVKERVVLSETQNLVILAQIILGIRTLHGKTISMVHRDLKPGNIFVKGNGEMKIGDFESCRKVLYKKHRLHKAPTKPTEFMRTPDYLPVEYYEGICEKWDKRRKFDGLSNHTPNKAYDIWAVGLVMYELFFGKMPFEFEEDWSMFKYEDCKEMRDRIKHFHKTKYESLKSGKIKKKLYDADSGRRLKNLAARGECRIIYGLLNPNPEKRKKYFNMLVKDITKSKDGKGCTSFYADIKARNYVIDETFRRYLENRETDFYKKHRDCFNVSTDEEGEDMD